MADMVVVRALRDNFSTAEITTAYADALAAHMARNTEVTITATSFAEGNASGQIVGDPMTILEACQIALDQIAAEEPDAEVSPAGPYHVDFSRQFTRT